MPTKSGVKLLNSLKAIQLNQANLIAMTIIVWPIQRQIAKASNQKKITINQILLKSSITIEIDKQEILPIANGKKNGKSYKIKL